jgi:hypothetical protein
MMFFWALFQASKDEEAITHFELAANVLAKANISKVCL